MALKHHIVFREWKKYLVTLGITLVIFGTAIGVSMWIDSARVNNVRSLQDNISLNILSSETQFNLLKDASCSDLFNSDLATQLSDIGDRLSFLESTGHRTDADVVSLRQYYYLLEIKDYMLISSATKCPIRPATVLYFYEPNCADCDKQGDVLTYLRQHYPDNIRVYSFDYSLDVQAVRTLANVNKVSKPMPAIVINGKSYAGFQSVDDVVAIAPKIISNRTRLVLSPHLDDAVSALGGLLAKSVHSANSPIITTVFTGIPKVVASTTWDMKSGFNNSTAAVTHRLEENNDAANILGVQVKNMGYLDAQYRITTATTSLENKITADIIKLIKTYDTSTSSIEIYGPAIFPGEIGHSDHTILHEAYLNVMAQYKPRGLITFFIYEDFPYSEEAGANAQKKFDMIKMLRADAQQFSYTPIYIPLSDDIAATKNDAIRAYDSQLKAMTINGIDLVKDSLNWTKHRCDGLFKIPSACEVVYQVQK
ncbi:MAG: PIG-L family deacetylase [Candidatus Taylorbacteria bacterium]